MLPALCKPKTGLHLRTTPHYPRSKCQLRLESAKCYRQLYTSSGGKQLRTALFFPGHGVQRVGMVASWAHDFPYITQRFLSEMDTILGFRLSRLISEGPNSDLNKTENSQPAIMATSILILRILQESFDFDIKSRVDVTLGHSLGEFSALVAGGYLSFGDALRIVRRRAEIMAQCTRYAAKQSGETYGMVALICEPDHLDELLSAIHEFLDLSSPGLKDDSSSQMPPIEHVMIANINSRNQIVLSGSLERIRTLLIQLRQFGGHDPRAVRLNSESPFHSPIMAPAAQYTRNALDHITIDFPAYMPCVSNVSGRPFASTEQLKLLLSQQCIATVKWWESIRFLDQEEGVKRWLGLGPGKVGRNLVGKGVGRVDTQGGGVWAICDPRELERIMVALEQTEAGLAGD